MSLLRTYNTDSVKRAMAQYSDQIEGFYPEEWLRNHQNIALTNDNGNVCLFEREALKVVSGHYFFFDRGKKAIEIAQQMLHEIFTGPYDVEVIRGYTPVEHKGAVWLSRRLGFKSYGTIQTPCGECVLFILTKKEYLERESD